MDAFYHGLETSLLAFGFALSLGAFAMLANPPVSAPSIALPMLTVEVPQAAR